jgi:hypothetical protein
VVDVGGWGGVAPHLHLPRHYSVTSGPAKAAASAAVAMTAAAMAAAGAAAAAAPAAAPAPAAAADAAAAAPRQEDAVGMRTPHCEGLQLTPWKSHQQCGRGPPVKQAAEAALPRIQCLA